MVPTSTTGIVGNLECIVAPVATLLGCSLTRQVQPTPVRIDYSNTHRASTQLVKKFNICMYNNKVNKLITLKHGDIMTKHFLHVELNSWLADVAFFLLLTLIAAF